MRWAVLAVVLAFGGVAQAATQQQAQATLDAAEKADAQAATFKNRWIPTETALDAARAALKAGDWDNAQDAADEALALAQRSVQQSQEQAGAWQDAVVR